MQSDADAISMLCGLTGLDPQQAAALLANAGGDMQLAVNDHFLAMEGGGEAATAGSQAAATAGEEGEEGDDDGSDGWADDDSWEDEQAPSGLGPTPSSAHQLPPPPSKRTKVELRQPPTLASLSPELRAQLQKVFALASPPADGANQVRTPSRAHDRVRMTACARREGAATSGLCPARTRP